MKRNILLFALIFTVWSGAWCADAARITGTVVDAVTKEPLEGASVLLKEDNVTATCDREGKFSAATARKRITLVAQFPGYAAYKKTHTLPLAPLMIELDLSADYTMGKVYVKDKYKIEGTKQKVKAEQIRKTTASLFSDSLKVVQTLPGVVTGDDFSSLMYIRGGEAYESISFLDNVFIRSPYMWGGVESIFNPAFVDRIDFYSGGFPVKYYQGLSAVLDVKNIEGNYDKHNGYTELSPTTFEVFAEGPMAAGRSSYVFGVRRTYYDMIVSLLYGDKYGGIVFPFFYDSQSKFTWKLNDRDKLYLTTLASYEGMSFDSSKIKDRDPDQDDFKFNYRDVQFLPALNWERVASDDLSLGVTLSLKYQEATNGFSGEDVTADVNQRAYDLYLKNRVTYVHGRHTFEQGNYMFRMWLDAQVDSRYRSLRGDATYVYDSMVRRFDWTKVGAYGTYLQDDIELVRDKFFLNIGGLCEHLDYTKETTFSPRGGLKYALTRNATLKFSTGLYTQFPFSGDGPPPLFENSGIKSEKAVHYVLGYEQDLPRNFFLRLEAYRKDYFDRVVADPDPDIDYTNNGKRKALGFETFLQKKLGGKWDGWFSYSYLYARDFIESRSDPLAHNKSDLDYMQPVGEWYPFGKERTHSTALVLNYEFDKNRVLAVTYRFSTGTPFTDVAGVVQNGLVYAPVYGKYQDGRLPDYSRIDVKYTMPVKRIFFFFKPDKAEVFFQIINLLNAENIDKYYYNDSYTVRKSAQMLPLIPIAGLRIYF